MLTELARQVGLAFHNSQLDSALQTTLDELRKQADELRESRARIVASGDAERRRVERNLHDGAQQHLVALAVNLRLARDIVADDPEAAGEMLDQLADDVQADHPGAARAGPRHLPAAAGRQRPAETRCARPRAAARSVVVTVADGIGRYPAEIEAAVYFCCLEALQNAAKHAPDAHGGDAGCGRSPAACCSRSPTTARGSIPRRPAAVTGSSTWPTGSAPSAARCAGTPSRGTGPRSAGRSRWSPRRQRAVTAGRRRRSPAPPTAAAARRRRSAPC